MVWCLHECRAKKKSCSTWPVTQAINTDNSDFNHGCKVSQGSSFLATLGLMMESLQDSENALHRLDDSNPLGLILFHFDSSPGVFAPLPHRAE